MAWNIALMCVKADASEIENVIPDVFGKTDEGMWFEDASSSRMGSCLSVGVLRDWIIIIDVTGRIISNDKFPADVSHQFPVKTFWISEGLIFRQYEEGQLKSEIKGIEEAGKYLESHNIQPKDESGETRIIQILEHEVLNTSRVSEDPMDDLFETKFDKYELD